MKTMKEVLASFIGKKLDVTFENGVISISERPSFDPYPSYEIQEVGTDVFKMAHRSAKPTKKLVVASNYYRIDKVLVIGPITS